MLEIGVDVTHGWGVLVLGVLFVGGYQIVS
jgi:hypothetical protein